MVLAPENGASASIGSVVLLRGQGYFLEEAQPETVVLAWNSSIDGELGRGTVVEWRPRSEGEHRIVLTAGADDRQGSADITIQVRRLADVGELPRYAAM
jgi:hypothetical protein